MAFNALCCVRWLFFGVNSSLVTQEMDVDFYIWHTQTYLYKACLKNKDTSRVGQ